MCSSPYVCLSLCLFTLSLSYASSVYYFKKTPLLIFCKKKTCSFVHPFLQNCFCSISFVVSHLFLICFFNRVLSNKRNWHLFSFGRKTICLKPPRTFFLKFCHLMFLIKKIFHRFSNFFLKSLFWKICFFEFRTKNPTKWHLQPTMFVPISFSDNLFVLRKISVSPAFWEKCILSSLSCVSYRSKVFLKKISFDKIVSLKKTKLLLSPLDFCSIFFLRAKTLLFSSCPFIFWFVVFFSFFFFCLFFFWCLSSFLFFFF